MSLPLEVADLVDEFAIPGGVTLERRGPGTIDPQGAHVDAAPTTVVLRPCAVVPVTGRAAVEGLDRGRETLTLVARQAIYAGDQTRAADVAIYAGRRWTVTNVQDHNVQGGVWIASAELQERIP